MSYSITSDFSAENNRINEEMPFLDHIKKFNATVGQEFERRVNELNKLAAVMENHFDLVDEGRRPQLFSQLSYGVRRAVEAVSWAIWLRKEAYKRVKQAKGLAWHENFYNYVEKSKEDGRKIKETDTSRNMYMEIDPGVVKAREEEAIAEAILEQFSGLKFEFIQGQASLKAIYYGNKETNSMNSAASPAGYGD